MNPFVILNNPFPCKTCTAECCSSIPFLAKDWDRAVQFLGMKSGEEIIRLAKQKRHANECIFIDKQDHTCSIYEVRPTLCELFGLHPHGKCTYAPQIANTMTQREADNKMIAASVASGGKIFGISGVLTLSEDVNAMTSFHFDWGHVIKAIDPGCEITRRTRGTP